MKISGENYPAYFLDYYEGTLTDGQVAELKNFLAQNPQLQHEFDSYESIILEAASDVKIPDKEILKKRDSLTPLAGASLDDFCIAAMEGDLDPNQEKSFLLLLNENYQCLETYNLYQKTRIAADNNSRFTSKSALKILIPDQVTPDRSSLRSVENAMIAFHEGDLNEDEVLHLLQYISSDSEAARDFSEYEKLRLQPDLKVFFPSKAILKHHSIVPVLKKVWLYAAALLIPAISISLYITLSTPESTDEVVVNNTNKIKSATEWQKPVTPPPAAAIKTLVAQTIAPPINPIPGGLSPANQLDSIERRVSGEAPGAMTMLSAVVNSPFDATLDKPIIALKAEFDNWIAMGFYDQSETAEVYGTSTNHREINNSFLSNLALLGVEKISGIDVYKTTGRTLTRDLSFWDFAGAGLAGISQLTGASLVVNKDLDENGRISFIEIGENIRVQR